MSLNMPTGVPNANGGDVWTHDLFELAYAPAAGPEPPSVTAVSPSTVAAGSPARFYVVDGADFEPDVQIEFDTVAVPTNYMTPTSAATGDIASLPDPGTVAVQVRNGPTGTPSNEVTITYTGEELESP